MVYNWGVFDFNTPHFVWKFAKGRLDYVLDTSDFQLFLQEYYLERRSVYCQKINLEPVEKRELLGLIQTNLLPQNRSYRYDFFYDDCSTRIRDLIEKVVGRKLIYPPDETNKIPTFRTLVGEYQRPYPWLKMGVDLIMGTPGEAKADFRDRMFLPLDLQRNLTQAVINRDRKMVPLLSSSSVIVEFERARTKSTFYSTPFFIFTLLFIIIMIISAIIKKGRLIHVMDILLFSLFSILSILMVFFNFFSDHMQMKLNVNLIWFNPVILICLFCIIFKKPGFIWFRIVFFLSTVFLILLISFQGALNSSFVPIIMILILRSSVRADFKWNPLSIEI
jgi:hypothetical protein